MYDDLIENLITQTCTNNSSLTAQDNIYAAAFLNNRKAILPVRVSIITNPYLTVHKSRQLFIPRSKKKRIIKKCKKLYTLYYDDPNIEHVYVIKQRESIVCHPAMEAALRQALIQGGCYLKMDVE
jgi:hypothetical protein